MNKRERERHKALLKEKIKAKLAKRQDQGLQEAPGPTPAHHTSAQPAQSFIAIDTLLSYLEKSTKTIETPITLDQETRLSIIGELSQAAKKIDLRSLKDTLSLVEQLPDPKAPEIAKALKQYLSQFDALTKHFDAFIKEPSKENLENIKKTHDLLNTQHEAMVTTYSDDIKIILFELSQKPTEPTDKIKYLLKKYIKIIPATLSQELFLKLSYKIDANAFSRFEGTVNQLGDLLRNLDAQRYPGDDAWKLIKKISEGYYSDSQIAEISLGIVEEYPILTLLEYINNEYQKLELDQKVYILKFAQALLMRDKIYQNIVYPSLASEIQDVIAHLENQSGSDAERAIIDSTKTIISNKTKEQTSTYQLFLNALIAGDLSVEAIERRVNRLSQQFENHQISAESCVMQFYDILTQGHAKYFLEFSGSTVMQSFKKACQQFPGVIENQLATILDMRSLQASFQTPHLPRHRPYQAYALNPVQTQEWVDLNHKLASVFDNNDIEKNPDLVPVLTDLAKDLALNIENHFKKIFIDSSLTEFKNAAWIIDEQNTKANLKIELNAPHIKAILNFEQAIKWFIVDSIFFKQNDDFSKEYRKQRSTMEHVVQFYDQALSAAIQMGATHAMHAIALALESPAIKRLQLSAQNTMAVNLLSTSRSLKALSEQDYIPYIPALLRKLADFFYANQTTEKQYDRIRFGGIIIKKIKDYQADLQKEDLQTQWDLPAILKYALNESDVLIRVSTLDEPQLNESALEYKYNAYSSALYIPIEKTLTMRLSEIEGGLNYCKEHGLSFPFLFDPAHPDYQLSKNRFIDILARRVRTEKHLPSLLQIRSIIQSAESLLDLVMPEHKHYYSDRNKILRAYSLRLHAIAKPPVSEKNQEVLDAFYKDLAKSPELHFDANAALVADGLISEDKKEFQQNTKYLLQLKMNLDKKITTHTQEKSTEAYLKNLSSYLVSQQAQSLTLPGGKAEEQKTQHPSLSSPLADLGFEYESHPEIIGQAQTMDVFTEVGSASHPFSEANLKQLFLKAFPWAKEPDQVSAEQHDRSLAQETSDNLLGLNYKLDPHAQKAILNLVFASLDTIGKLAGPEGEYVLQNLQQIDHIIAALDKVSDTLNHPKNLRNPATLNAIIDSIETRAQAIYQNDLTIHQKLMGEIPLQSDEVYSPSTSMNAFLHYNEEQSHRLLQDFFAGKIDWPSYLTK